MKAAQARSKAVSIAQKEAAEKSAALKKRRAALKESVPRLRKERIAKIEKQFRDSIESVVEYGERSTSITLSQDGHDCLRGEYKYLPTKVDRYYYGDREIRTWYHAWGEGYLKYAPWGKYVKIVLAKLRRDGYKCEVTGENTHHDDSAAYLNSGGECGSETPYYTRDTILTIKW
jgi:hypothetical protein